MVEAGRGACQLPASWGESPGPGDLHELVSGESGRCDRAYDWHACDAPSGRHPRPAFLADGIYKGGLGTASSVPRPGDSEKNAIGGVGSPLYSGVVTAAAKLEVCRQLLAAPVLDLRRRPADYRQFYTALTARNAGL